MDYVARAITSHQRPSDVEKSEAIQCKTLKRKAVCMRYMQHLDGQCKQVTWVWINKRYLITSRRVASLRTLTRAIRIWGWWKYCQFRWTTDKKSIKSINHCRGSRGGWDCDQRLETGVSDEEISSSWLLVLYLFGSGREEVKKKLSSILNEQEDCSWIICVIVWSWAPFLYFILNEKNKDDWLY